MGNYLHIENNKILFKEESYAIQGAIFELYKEIGSGFLEPIYQECLIRELTLKNIPFIAQPEMRLSYKGVPLEQVYRPDFVCYDSIILELKATKVLTDDFRAQFFNYLKISKMRLGLLTNFGHIPRVEIERIVL